MKEADRMERLRNILSRMRGGFVALEIIGLIGLMVTLVDYRSEGVLVQRIFAGMIYAGMLGVLLWAVINLVYQWRNHREEVISDLEKTVRWFKKAIWAFAGMILLGSVGEAIPYVRENRQGLHMAGRWMFEIGWIGVVVWIVLICVQKRMQKR